MFSVCKNDSLSSSASDSDYSASFDSCFSVKSIISAFKRFEILSIFSLNCIYKSEVNVSLFLRYNCTLLISDLSLFLSGEASLISGELLSLVSDTKFEFLNGYLLDIGSLLSSKTYFAGVLHALSLYISMFSSSLFLEIIFKRSYIYLVRSFNLFLRIVVFSLQSIQLLFFTIVPHLIVPSRILFFSDSTLKSLLAFSNSSNIRSMDCPEILSLTNALFFTFFTL